MKNTIICYKLLRELRLESLRSLRESGKSGSARQVDDWGPGHRLGSAADVAALEAGETASGIEPSS